MKEFAAFFTLFLSISCEAFTSFSADVTFAHRNWSRTQLFESSTSTEDDILKPSYEIEPLPMRIGHGFDIHRMAPIDDAGQPVVIGGVTIDHKDQKVRHCLYLGDTPHAISHIASHNTYY